MEIVSEDLNMGDVFVTPLGRQVTREKNCLGISIHNLRIVQG